MKSSPRHKRLKISVATLMLLVSSEVANSSFHHTYLSLFNVCGQVIYFCLEYFAKTNNLHR